MSLHHNNLTVIKGSSVKVIIQQVRDFFPYSIQKLPNIVGLVKLNEILREITPSQGQLVCQVSFRLAMHNGCP